MHVVISSSFLLSRKDRLGLVMTRLWKFTQFQGSATGPTALLLPAAMCGARRSWTADRCTAILVRLFFFASVYAPTSRADPSDYEIFMVDVTRILTEGRQRGAEKESSLYGPHVWTSRCKNLHHCLEESPMNGDSVENCRLLSYFDMDDP